MPKFNSFYQVSGPLFCFPLQSDMWPQVQLLSDQHNKFWNTSYLYHLQKRPPLRRSVIVLFHLLQHNPQFQTLQHFSLTRVPRVTPIPTQTFSLVLFSAPSLCPLPRLLNKVIVSPSVRRFLVLKGQPVSNHKGKK